MVSGTLERCSLHGWIPVFTVQGRWQTVCMASCGWAVCWCQHCGSSGVMVWAGICCGQRTQVHFIDEIPWRDPEIHSSTTITSCCSMIMHDPMLQGSVHNSWKLKTSKFLHCQHTHRTCPPLSMFGMLWISVYDSVFQFLPITSNFTQPLKRSGPTFHNQQPDQLYAKEMCCTARGKLWSHQILTGFQLAIQRWQVVNTVHLHFL